MTEHIFKKITNDAQRKVRSLAARNGWLWFYNLHQKEVIVYAGKLLRLYPQANRQIVIISCWLHDIAHYYAKNGQEILAVKANHHIRGAEIAENFLSSYKISGEELEKIKKCIICHRNSTPYRPKALEEKVVAVADTMSHFGSIFYFTYFKFHPRHSLEQMVADDLAKLERDWRDIKLLPQAGKLVVKEYQLIRKLLSNYKV